MNINMTLKHVKRVIKKEGYDCNDKKYTQVIHGGGGLEED